MMLKSWPRPISTSGGVSGAAEIQSWKLVQPEASKSRAIRPRSTSPSRLSMNGAASGRIDSDRNRKRERESTIIFLSAAAAAMVDSGTAQPPARMIPMKT